MAWEANLDARTAYMLQNQTVNLPPHQQQRLHADFLANEQAYLQMRNNPLPQYRGQWVAVHGGQVVVSGVNLMEVMDRAFALGGHPFITLVGAEDDTVFRARRQVFAYDQVYQPFPLPRLTATFLNHAEAKAQQNRTWSPPDARCALWSCSLSAGRRERWGGSPCHENADDFRGRSDSLLA